MTGLLVSGTYHIEPRSTVRALLKKDDTYIWFFRSTASATPKAFTAPEREGPELEGRWTALRKG